MIAVLATCIPVMAQWTKPTMPASTPLAAETQLYLYNVDAVKFFTVPTNGEREQASVQL